jgi:hypothetical protein
MHRWMSHSLFYTLADYQGHSGGRCVPSRLRALCGGVFKTKGKAGNSPRRSYLDAGPPRPDDTRLHNPSSYF